MHKNVSFLSWNCWKYVDNKRKKRGRDSRPLQSQAQRLQRTQTPSSNGKPRVREAELCTSHSFFRQLSGWRCIVRESLEVVWFCNVTLFRGLGGRSLWGQNLSQTYEFTAKLNVPIFHHGAVLQLLRSVPKVKMLFLHTLCYELKFLNNLGFLLWWTPVTDRFQATSIEH